jgi:hypothetical protein
MRKELAEKLKKLFDSGRFKAVDVKKDGFPEDAIVVVTRVADFDPASNDEWDLYANKSKPRDLHCGGCGEQVVMSNGMYEAYLAKDGKPEMVRCNVCIFSSLSTTKSEQK